MKIKSYLYAVIILNVTACATGPTLIIKSSTPAIIEVEGRLACKTTPCVVAGMAHLNGFHECIGGADTLIEAFPLNETEGFRQSKKVYANCNEEVPIFFNMKSRGAVTTFDGGSNETIVLSKKIPIETRLEELQNLKNKGLLNEKEYSDQKKKILGEL
jgi:hypothetical protein